MVLVQKQTCWNRTKDPEVKQHTHGHLIFDKDVNYIQWRKASIFNKWCWSNWLSIQKNENRPIFVTLYKAQVHVDQGPQHKTLYTEYNTRESGKEP